MKATMKMNLKKKAKYNGEGEIKYKSGDMYKGEWKDGKKEGKGIYIYYNDKKFEGIFKEDKIFEGNGYIYYENGDIYNGEIKNGMKNGKGKIIYYNNNKYEGEWKNDKKNKESNAEKNNVLFADYLL